MVSKNTYLDKEISELPSSTYNSEKLSELVSKWMGLLPGKAKYLVSLNPDDYLVTTCEIIKLEDMLAVARTWKIDSWIGVFDESCTMSFIFDIEFGLAITSFDPSCTPDGYTEFSRTFNSEFKEVFVRDAKIRTGADSLRVEEYMEKSEHLIG